MNNKQFYEQSRNTKQVIEHNNKSVTN